MDRRFGNYILHERVGVGGMGEVFRATKHGADGFEVQVALKLILPHLAREEAFRRRFAREAKFAASLKHPNIVQVNGFSVIDEIPFIEMEFVQGSDLRRILRSLSTDQKLGLDESLAVIHAVARALIHAHSRDGHGGTESGIIHCDLNPHNILISGLGEIKVTDFGIARALYGDEGASATVRGKLAYMSPEQVDGDNLDTRTDLFSLGIIAYQLLTGDHPFERGSEGATISAIRKGEHRHTRECEPGLPEPLHVLIEQLLSVHPSSRPKSAAAVVEIIEPLVPNMAANSLGLRVRSMESEPTSHTGDGEPLSPTAPTLRRADLRQYVRFVIPVSVVAAVTIGMLLLPSGITTVQHRVSEPEEHSQGNVVDETVRAAVHEFTVNVRSQPPGAEIWADGNPMGSTPLDIQRKSDGAFPVLEAVLYGFQRERFPVPPDTEGELVLNLKPLPRGTVRISARPWARVTFRGEMLGETPVTIADVPAGTHEFTLLHEPLEKKRTVKLVVKEGINTLSVDMREEGDFLEN